MNSWFLSHWHQLHLILSNSKTQRPRAPGWSPAGEGGGRLIDDLGLTLSPVYMFNWLPVDWNHRSLVVGLLCSCKVRDEDHAWRPGEAAQASTALGNMCILTPTNKRTYRIYRQNGIQLHPEMSLILVCVLTTGIKDGKFLTTAGGMSALEFLVSKLLIRKWRRCEPHLLSLLCCQLRSREANLVALLYVVLSHL